MEDMADEIYDMMLTQSVIYFLFNEIPVTDEKKPAWV